MNALKDQIVDEHNAKTARIWDLLGYMWCLSGLAISAYGVMLYNVMVLGRQASGLTWGAISIALASCAVLVANRIHSIRKTMTVKTVQ